MKPFRYLTDAAYVVPALRSHSAWPKMNRRKVAIVVGVLSAHAALIWALVNMAVNTPPPIEFVETQVVLEQVTPDSPVPTAIPPSPKVIKRQQEKVTPQPQQARRVNNDAVIKETVKPQQQPQPIPTTSETPAKPQTQPTQPAATAPAKPAASASAGKCNQAFPLRIISPLVERDMTVRVLIRRGASSVTSASLQNSSGNASLDSLIVRKAQGLRFVSKDEACAGQSFTIAVQLAE